MGLAQSAYKYFAIKYRPQVNPVLHVLLNQTNVESTILGM